MAREIERKFLVNDRSYRSLAEPLLVRQGFLFNTPGLVSRVRIIGDKAYLTIKGHDSGLSRDEFEYPIPLADASYLLEKMCQMPLIEKLRFRIAFEGFAWDVDEFLGDNAGLVVAEIELEQEDQDFPRPAWIGREVTGDPKYYNANLVKHPFREWRERTSDT